MDHINIEIKARCQDPGRLRAILRSENADFKGTDHQIDTYFKVNMGRLKLREGDIENHLIFYEREDQNGPKQSNVTLYNTVKGSGIKEILARSLGVLFVVDKVREIYFIGNVKFHLDSVNRLGTFMEIEAIDIGGKTREELLGQCNSYMGLLGIKEDDLLSGSYSDMLMEGRA